MCCQSASLQGCSPRTIASEGTDITRVHWTFVDRLCQVRDSVQGQPVFAALPSVTGRRSSRHRSSVQRLLGQRSLSTSLVRSWAEIFASTSEREPTLVQSDPHLIVSMEDMMRQLQETMQTMQRDAAHQTEVVAQQAELIARLQQQQQPQQAGASALHLPPPPPPPRVPTLGETTNVQENTDVPTGPVPPPIPPQMSKAPANPVDTPFEFKVDPTTLKMSKVEKLFKRAQGVNLILDIEDGYTNSAVTLSDRFKMPHIDRFDGSGDPMVHLRLFSDILRPMRLTRL
ncbi:hypothetical protein ACSBR2_002525 [Camellia fascicularis]